MYEVSLSNQNFPVIRSLKPIHKDLLDYRELSPLKELCHGLHILKSLAWIFQIRRLQSVSIFAILSHPCSFIVYYYLFDVFLS